VAQGGVLGPGLHSQHRTVARTLKLQTLTVFDAKLQSTAYFVQLMNYNLFLPWQGIKNIRRILLYDRKII
jgi:hypothetical protein